MARDARHGPATWHVLAEGLTEVLFLQRVLAPALRDRGVRIQAYPVMTRAVLGEPPVYGGLPGFPLLETQFRRLLALPGGARVTMMFDFYGWPRSYPGGESAPRGDAYAAATHLEEALGAVIDDPRFEPHLMVHETETLLFACPEDTDAQHPRGGIRDDLVRAVAQARGNPELVNGRVETSPSHRLQRLWRPFRYGKTTDGIAALQRAGLPRLRAACPRFDRWVRVLED